MRAKSRGARKIPQEYDSLASMDCMFDGLCGCSFHVAFDVIDEDKIRMRTTKTAATATTLLLQQESIEELEELQEHQPCFRTLQHTIGRFSKFTLVSQTHQVTFNSDSGTICMNCGPMWTKNDGSLISLRNTNN